MGILQRTLQASIRSVVERKCLAHLCKHFQRQCSLDCIYSLLYSRPAAHIPSFLDRQLCK